MEYTSYSDIGRIKSTFEQIKAAIDDLKEWNKDVSSAEVILYIASRYAEVSCKLYVDRSYWRGSKADR